MASVEAENKKKSHGTYDLVGLCCIGFCVTRSQQGENPPGSMQHSLSHASDPSPFNCETPSIRRPIQNHTFCIFLLHYLSVIPIELDRDRSGIVTFHRYLVELQSMGTTPAHLPADSPNRGYASSDLSHAPRTCRKGLRRECLKEEDKESCKPSHATSVR
jgi:hypothetical protein